MLTYSALEFEELKIWKANQRRFNDHFHEHCLCERTAARRFWLLCLGRRLIYFENPLPGKTCEQTRRPMFLLYSGHGTITGHALHEKYLQRQKEVEGRYRSSDRSSR